MLQENTILVRLVMMIDSLPQPPATAKRRRGKPKRYSEKLILKALIRPCNKAAVCTFAEEIKIIMIQIFISIVKLTTVSSLLHNLVLILIGIQRSKLFALGCFSLSTRSALSIQTEFESWRWYQVTFKSSLIYYHVSINFY